MSTREDALGSSLGTQCGGGRAGGFPQGETLILDLGGSVLVGGKIHVALAESTTNLRTCFRVCDLEVFSLKRRKLPEYFTYDSSIPFMERKINHSVGFLAPRPASEAIFIKMLPNDLTYNFNAYLFLVNKRQYYIKKKKAAPGDLKPNK